MGAGESKTDTEDVGLSGLCCLKQRAAKRNLVEPKSFSDPRASKGFKVSDDLTGARSNEVELRSSPQHSRRGILTKSLSFGDSMRKTSFDGGETTTSRLETRALSSRTVSGILRNSDNNVKGKQEQCDWTAQEKKGLEFSVKMAAAHLNINPPKTFTVQVKIIQLNAPYSRLIRVTES